MNATPRSPNGATLQGQGTPATSTPATPTEPSTPDGPVSATPYRQPSPGVELGGVLNKRDTLNTSSDLISEGEGEGEGEVGGGGEFMSPSLASVRRGSVKDMAKQFSGQSRYLHKVIY